MSIASTQTSNDRALTALQSLRARNQGGSTPRGQASLSPSNGGSFDAFAEIFAGIAAARIPVSSPAPQTDSGANSGNRNDLAADTPRSVTQRPSDPPTTNRNDRDNNVVEDDDDFGSSDVDTDTGVQIGEQASTPTPAGDGQVGGQVDGDLANAAALADANPAVAETPLSQTRSGDPDRQRDIQNGGNTGPRTNAGDPSQQGFDQGGAGANTGDGPDIIPASPTTNAATGPETTDPRNAAFATASSDSAAGDNTGRRGQTPDAAGQSFSAQASRSGEQTGKSNQRNDGNVAATATSANAAPTGLADSSNALASNAPVQPQVSPSVLAAIGAAATAANSGAAVANGGASRIASAGPAASATNSNANANATSVSSGEGRNATTVAGADAKASKSVDNSDLIARVKLVQRVAKAFSHLRRDGGLVRIRVAPEALGSVSVELRVQRGHVDASVVAESEAAATTLREHLPELKAKLEQSGLKVDRLEVATDAEREQNSNRSFDGSDPRQWQQPSGDQRPRHPGDWRPGGNQTTASPSSDAPSTGDNSLGPYNDPDHEVNLVA